MHLSDLFFPNGLYEQSFLCLKLSLILSFSHACDDFSCVLSLSYFYDRRDVKSIVLLRSRR